MQLESKPNFSTLYLYLLIHFLLFQLVKWEDEKAVKRELMAKEGSKLSSIYRRFKPHLLMALAQFGYTFLYFITEASFNHGMNPHVYITYRHIVGGLVTFPFAYFLERYINIYLYLYEWTVLTVKVTVFEWLFLYMPTFI